MRLTWLALVVGVPLLIETVISTRHERALRRRGAIEPADDVYPLMRVVYPASLAAMLAEGAGRTAGPHGRPQVAGVMLFAASKLLKAWVILSLQDRWSFRVLVLPGVPLVTGGPYRFAGHPNYWAVMGELAGVALMAGARRSGPGALVAFAWILARRIRAEERALAEVLRPSAARQADRAQ